MQNWPPHVTVATVIEREGAYLLVEERDKNSGALVFNQPAGHLDPGESLTEAALRETREETGWEIELSGLLGIALYTAPGNGVTYYRTTFVGKPVHRLEHAVLDPDIHAVHWLDYEAILANSARMRSPLVIAAVEQHRRGNCYPLGLIYSQP
jgi:8-oxo-dGTP pyrophosphatase MutT (NUDIX family)